jgi:hypothetical protein
MPSIAAVKAARDMAGSSIDAAHSQAAAGSPFDHSLVSCALNPFNFDLHRY